MTGVLLLTAFVLAVWIAPTVIVAKLADDDGRSPATWGCLSLVFGWPVLVIYLVTRGEVGATSVAPATAPRRVRRCPACGEPIPALATVCRICGARVDTVPDPPPASRWTPSGPLRTCPHCRRPTPEASEVCVNCGESSVA
jgi:RNA polymerase subunit RPABC4/transcription elongation factor Spt4